MQILKVVLIIIYFIVCLALIILTMMQSKDDEGLSATITGTSSTNNFYEKNRANTKIGKQKRWTIILGIVLVILCIVLGTIYVL